MGTRRAQLVVGVAALVAVLAVLFVVVVGDGDGDGAGDDPGIDGGPPHVVLDPVPDELTLTAAFTGPPDVSIFDAGTVLVYADTTRPDPLGGPVLISTTVQQPGAEPATGEPVEVQGIAGTRYAAPGRNGVVVSWPSGPDRLQILTAVGLDSATLLEAAEGVLGDEGEIQAESLPAGFDLAGRDSFTALTSFGRGFLLDGPGAGTLAYSNLSEGTELVISSGPGGQERVELMRPFLDDLQNVDVNGTFALAGNAEGSPAITWQLGETVVRLTGLGLTLDELIAFAQDIRPVDDEAFVDIVGEFQATR